MKTAVSLPNEIFQRAETAAKKLRILHTQAEMDPVLQDAQIDFLKQVEW
ncbi:MAG: hypothetical protein JOZ45_11245 [Acidobacteriaceae bacterium]|nr:hypothetical protein [Acidobacteriaceae bacterium]